MDPKTLITIAIGLLGGSLSGMFGIGGGILMVPLFTLWLGFEQHKAQGTSLGILMLPTGAFAIAEYWKKEAIDIPAAALAGLGFLVGAYLGSKISLGLDAVTIRKGFGVLLVVAGVYYVVRK
jgi:uncharacterized protein